MEEGDRGSAGEVVHSPCAGKKGPRHGRRRQGRRGGAYLLLFILPPPPFPSSSFVLCLLPLCCILPPYSPPRYFKVWRGNCLLPSATYTQDTRRSKRFPFRQKISNSSRVHALSLLLSSDQVEFPLWAASNGEGALAAAS